MVEKNTGTDLLTGLWTKAYFQEYLHEQLHLGELDAAEYTCVYFDVKNFKLFYSRNGFDTAYESLLSIANQIREEFDEDYLCRSSNDHFILLAKKDDLSERIRRVQDKVHNTWKHTGLELTAGTYDLEPGENDMVYVCANAKMACKSAEAAGSGISQYDGKLERSIRLKQHIMHHFSDALKMEHIKIYYQPILLVISGRMCGYEALSRWDDPEYGILMPDEFLPVLTEARQIHRLDCYMIRHVCADLKRYKEEGKTIVPVSLNLSKMDFELEDMLAVVNDSIEKAGVSKELLHFELSEGMLSDDRADMQKELVRFKEAGYQLGMDDFGGRDSTLHILKDMPFDTLKIDSSFIRDFEEGNRARIILKNILNMAKELGIQTMMGNIEDVDDMDFLRLIGCEKTQGRLFGDAEPFDDERHERMRPESDLERDYCDAIGRVNILSQAPLKTGWSYQEEDAALINLLPLAIMEFDGKKFHFMMYNANFQKVFAPLGVDGDTDPEHVFNNERLTFATQAKALAEQCIYTGTEFDQDFMTSDGFYRLMMRCVSYEVESDNGAIIAVAERMSEDNPAERGERMDSALRFLYSLYSRVDIVNGDGSDMKNVYIDSSRYNTPIVRGSIEKAIPKFARHNIYVEDQKKFIEFFNLSTIDERLEEVGGRYVLDYFRTKDAKGNYDWQMYMFIPIISEGQKMFLVVSRGIDAERMRRLPEISQSGDEYYDMPGNPVYLLLASSAFTNMLDYGSFDQFLRNSFFVEANLSENHVLNMHLGKQEIMGDGSDFSNMGIPYNEVIREMITGSVIEEEKKKVEDFYNREMLLERYAEGEIIGNIEYLRLPDQGNEKPRYMNTCYQMRQGEDGSIHIFILTFDVDDYRRTNETIHRLAERDTLTGLFNRSTSGMLIDRILNDTDTEDAAMVILDLDNFKQINDRYGHDCGDTILKDASSRMKEIFEPHGLVARIGGDEFLAVLKNMPAAHVDDILRNFTETKKTVTYHAHAITYTMSIGYAMFPAHGTEYNELYQNADLALYTVKMSGRNNFKRFMVNMQNSNREHLGFNIGRISEGMPGGFLVYRNNENQEIMFANKMLMDLYECSSMQEFREFTGNSFKGLVYPDDWYFIQECIEQQIKDYAGYDYIMYRAITKTGKMILVEDYGRLCVSDDDGELFYVFMLDYGRKQENYGHIIEHMERHLIEET